MYNALLAETCSIRSVLGVKMKQRIVWLFAYVLAGVLGASLVLGSWHIWQDHAALHALVNIEMQRQQQSHGPAEAPGK